MEYIAAYHLHETLKEKLMDKKNVAFNTFVHSPAYLFHYPKREELLFKAYEILRVQKEKWPLLEEILLFPQTIETVLNFIQNLKLYEIGLEELPENNAMNRSIKGICTVLWDLIDEPVKLEEKHRILPYFLDHASYHYSRSKHWELNIEDPKQKDIELYYAQNKRQEIEAVIQDIILRQENEVALVVPNKNDSLALIESVLRRYGQKVDLQKREHQRLKHKLLSLLEFFVQEDHFTFVKSIENNAFQIKYPGDYLLYLRHFEIELENLPENLNFALDEEKYIYRIQKRIQKDHEKIYSLIQEAKGLSYREKLVFVYDFYRQDKQHDLSFFRQFLIEYQNYLQEDYHPIIRHLLQRGQNEQIQHPQFQVFDYLNLPLSFSGTIYFLSLNAQNFPAIREEKGLIDEHYLAQIKSYPSQNIRSGYMLEQKRWIYRLGSRQVFSYVLANYEGKALEPAFEILDYAHKNQVKEKMWPLIERKNADEREEKLSEDIAKELFLKEDLLYGSISSLQKYAKDPLLYFKEYGLKVREEIEPSFNALVLGNLNHAMMEGRPFELEWKKVTESFPRDSLWIQMIEKRYRSYLKANQNYLKQSEHSSKFETIKKEYEIQGNDIHEKIYLKGYIDRIDQFEDEFMIIDYKTSEQSLSWARLVKAWDLQLLSYALMFAKQNNLQAHAAAFYAFNLPNTIHDKAYHYTATRGLEPDEIDPKEEWHKEKRFSAWYFSDPTPLYADIQFWKGLRETSKGFSINHWNKYRFDGLSKFLEDRFQRLYKLISSGELNIFEIEKELELDEHEEEKWKEVIQ